MNKKCMLLWALILIFCFEICYADPAYESEGAMPQPSSDIQPFTFYVKNRTIHDSVLMESGDVLLCGGSGDDNWLTTVNLDTHKVEHFDLPQMEGINPSLITARETKDGYLLCYADYEEHWAQIAMFTPDDGEVNILYHISNIRWSDFCVKPDSVLISGYRKNAEHTYDMVDCMVDWSGALLWTQTLPLGVAMPWGDNMINDTGNGYLFSTEQHIWKRNGKGELVWQKEPQLPEAFNLQKYCRVEDVDVVIGSYYPKQDDIPASLPLLLFLDQDGNLIHHRKYSAQELDITGDYFESVSVTFKEVRRIKEGIAVITKSYGIRRPQQIDFMLLDTEGEIVERYLLPISSEQDLVDMFVDSESRLRYVLSNLNQITIR